MARRKQRAQSAPNRRQLNADLREYLASGKKIEKVPIGASGQKAPGAASRCTTRGCTKLAFADSGRCYACEQRARLRAGLGR